jgi:hypothetical protein
MMKTGIVCVLDALGTKGVWSIDDPETYLNKLRAVHKTLIDLKDHGLKSGYPYILDYITFSDTIIITFHWDGVETEAMIPYIVRMIDGLYSSCLAEDLLMRGAMSYGRFIKEENIIIGPAIDDAASWHDKAQLVGCVLTPNTTLLYDSGIDYVERNPHTDYDYRQHAIKYKTPFKGGVAYDLYNVNWPLSTYKALNPLGAPSPLTRIKARLGKYPIPADAFNKHENTIDFFNYSVRMFQDGNV